MWVRHILLAILAFGCGAAVSAGTFAFLLVLGVAASISPIAFIMENVIDIIVLIVCSVLVLFFAWSKNRIDRKEGALMLLIYAVYAVYICVR